MPTYSSENFERIAAALGVGTNDVLLHASAFEEAATWYRHNVPPAKRQGGPTLELRNQRIMKVTEIPGLRKQRSRKSRPLSELRKKAKQVTAAAQKLLLHLGVRRLREAPDGPGDRELLTFLASYSGSSEAEIIGATARIGRLAELLEAINAAKTLKARAYEAAQEAIRFAKRLPKGHQGDVAVVGWTADMMTLWKRMTGREPGFSVLRPGAGRGQPTGPFLRFLQAAAEPLEIELSPASARSRQRALKESARRRQK
jgi:hypothetical protein